MRLGSKFRVTSASAILLVLMASFLFAPFMGLIEVAHAVNVPPSISNVAPANGAINTYTNPTLSVKATDANGYLMTIVFRTNVTGSWQDIGNYSGTDGTYTIIPTTMNELGTTYYWMACAGDVNGWTNNTYHFATTTTVLTKKWTATVPKSTGSVLIADINKDGLEEVIQAGQGGVVALSPIDGHVIWNTPVTGAGDDMDTQMADLNKDGNLEIIVPLRSPAGVHVLFSNGSTFWRTITHYGEAWSSPVICDIDGSGYPTIFIGSMSELDLGYNGTGGITKLSWDGKILQHVWVWHICAGGLSIDDADHDGQFELYAGDRPNDYGDGGYGEGVQSFWASNLTQRWANPTILCSSHIPMLADVNHDGIDEVIAGNHRGGIEVYNSVTGAPIRITGPGNPDAPIHYQPTVYDIDGDGHLEILMADGEHGKPNTVIWDLVDWKVDWTTDAGLCQYGPREADLTGDGIMDVIASSSNGIAVFQNHLNNSYSLVANVTGLAGWLTYPVVQDMDGDGYLELVVGSTYGRAYAFDTPARAPAQRIRSEVQFYSERRLGAAEYVPPPGPVAPVISSISPSNGATNVSVVISQLSFNLTDFQKRAMSYSVTTSPFIGSGSGTNVSDGMRVVTVSNLQYETTYTWNVNVTDGTNWTNKTYTFVTEPRGPWMNTSWQYRRTITINHLSVSSDQTDFPILIDLTDSGLTTKAQSNGNDFVFTDANQVQLSHEIESYSSGTGHLIVWIKVPVLSSTIDTVLYMYYGNPTCGNQQNKTAVWDSSNRMILHLAETSGTQYDSTINGNNATPNNGVIQGTAGKIDGSDTFDGTNDYLQIPHSDTLTGFSQGFTASFWLRLDDVSRRQTILNKYSSTTGLRSWYIEYQANRLGFFASQDGTNYGEWHAAFTPTAGTWYFITVTWEPNAVPKFYVNGAQVATSGTAKIASIYNNAEVPLYVGRCPYDTTRYLKGALDEIRISNPARSAGWIITSYNNQRDPSTFYHVGTEEALPSEPIVSDPNPINGATNVPITLTELSFNLTDYQHDLMTYYVTTTPNVGGSITPGVGNGEYSVNVAGLQYATAYTWQLNVTDGTNWTNRTYTFTTESKVGPLLVDSTFDNSTDSADLRTNGSGQDWYESRSAFNGGDATLLTLDTATIGGDAGKKAALKNYGIASNAYLSQEFDPAQTDGFDVSFDIYIDRIEANGAYNRAGHVYIGDDSIGTNAPTGTSNERFVCLAFYDPTPGDTGNDLELRARTQSSQTYGDTSTWTQVASGLSYDKWYTIKLNVNVTDGTYDLYLDGTFKGTFSKYSGFTSLSTTFITFAADSDGRGDFYVDNVFSPAQPAQLPLLVDSTFDNSTDSADLRTNGSGQDWYESRSAFNGGDATLLTLDTATIGGDAGKKAALKNYGIASNAYLSQEFDPAQTDAFSVSFDIYIDRIEDNPSYDRTGNVYLGDDHITTNCPTGTSAERFVCLGFYDPTPGDTGNDIILIARTSSGQSFGDSSSWITVATGLNYDAWITIKLAIDPASGTYDVYVNGILKGTFNKYDGYAATQIAYISFAADSDARGDYYVDNVFAPAVDRYGLTVTSTGSGTVEQNPGEATYLPNTVVTLTAEAAGGFAFTGWSGDLSGSLNPTTITMNSHKNVIATFTQQGSYDDVIFSSNFDMGNLRNVQYQSGDASGNRFYTGEQNHTTVSFSDKHWWFYFSMDNVNGKTVTIKLVNNEAVDFSGNRWPEIEPVYSFDNINWERLPLSNVVVDGTAFTFQMTVPSSLTSGHSKIWLAPLPPYTIDLRDALFQEFASSPYLTVTSLGTTPLGQELKVATITDKAYSDAGKIKAYVIAQQHAGEVPGSWEADGLIRFLLSDDPTAQAIRRSYIFRIVPIANVEGVYYGISRYTPLRNGVQYDLNRWWSYDFSAMPFEVAKIFADIQAFQPSSFNDLHSTINTEMGSPKDAVTYTWNTGDPTVVAFLNSIGQAGWPDTQRGTSPYACSQVNSRLGVARSISWENPHDEFITNPGHKLTVDDWRNMGRAYAIGVYLDGGDAQATLATSVVGSGSISKVPDQVTYPYGTSVQLTATPAPGYLFSNWSGDLSGNLNPASINMTGNLTVTAVFSPKPANWWNTSWQYRRTITIDHTKVSSDQTDFPVLIDLTDNGLTTKVQANGNDFVFTDANQIKLSHEIESYNSGTGHLIVWIKVPVLSSTTDTVLYMYYGNPTCGDQQTRNAVWDSSNRMVLHLAETSGTQYDSTINGNNATPNNGVIQGTAGKIDGSDTFDGTNDYLQIPHNDTLTGFSQGFTASFWLRLDDVSRRQTILNKYNNGAGQRSWYIEYQANRLGFFASQDGTNYGEWHAAFTPTAGTWYFITVTWEPNAVPKFYVNGAQVATSGTAKIASIYNNTGVALYIGRCPYDATRYLKGSLDEIRISNPARNASWILSSYNNQKDPTTFYQLGTEETDQYTLTIEIVGQGTVTKDPEQLTYTLGTVVSLTPSGDSGYVFDHWEVNGVPVGSDVPYLITMDSNKAVTAFFRL